MPLTKDLYATPVTDSTTVRRERTRSAGTERSASPTSWESGAEIHLIRLCLDLQLDAMLLALGAAAAESLRTRSAPGKSTGPAPFSGTAAPADLEPPPWHRWIREDVEVVSTLAADVMGGGAALPAALGTELDQAVPAAAIDDLIARYESMIGLLADILPPGPSRPPVPYRVHAQEALAHCQERLRDLRNTRLDSTPARGLTYTPPTDRPPVPGEWLG